MKKVVLLIALMLPLLALRAQAPAQTEAQTQAQSGPLGSRTFVYGEDVQLPHPIEIRPDDARPLSEILDAQLQGTNIRYRITPNHVLLFLPAKADKPQHTIYGYVLDATSKESLIGANLYAPLQLCGSSTNAYGHFSLSVPEGTVMLETSYVGYETHYQALQLTHDTLLTIALKPAHALHEVVVESERPETGATSTRAGAITIPIQQVLRTPSLLGEADVIKALQFQPGVQSALSGQSSMSVRGGDIDQNLYLLDGMLLYNVEHALGFESAFMPDIVKHVNFYRGSFSARHGGRLSSVTDVRTKDGDMQRYHGNFSIGLLSSHLSFEGPIVKDRTSFIISARRTYADWLINLCKGGLDIDIDRLDLYFYDLNAKINHKFSDNDRLYLSFYQGRDVTGIRDSYSNNNNTSYYKDKTMQDVRWGNTLYHLRWNHIFSPKLFANVTVGYNQFALEGKHKYDFYSYASNKLESDEHYKMQFNSGINDFSTLVDLDYHPATNHRITMGGQYTLHNFKPEIQSSSLKSREPNTPAVDEHYKTDNSSYHSHELALYAEDDMTLGDLWQANLGLRATLFTTDGKAFPLLEPRLSLCRILGDGLRAKASYNVMHQYVHKLTSAHVASPSDLWVPVTRHMKPMSAQQWSAGVVCNRYKGWEFGVDAYWKKMNHVIDLIDGASFAGNSKGWENKVTSGCGRAYGIELSAARTQGKTTGMLNYTLSKSDRRFADGKVNRGKTFPFQFDRRHVVHFLISHQLTERVDLNASWNYASGALVSLAKQQSAYIDPISGIVEGNYTSSRNNYRMEPTHQLDLSINIHKPTKHGERCWNFSVMNAYNHMNQDFLYTTIKEKWVDTPASTPGSGLWTDPDAPQKQLERKRVVKRITVIPLLPSFTYSYKF